MCDPQGMAVDDRIYQTQEDVSDEVITTEVEVCLRDRSLTASQCHWRARMTGRPTNISPADASSMTMKSKPLSSNVW